MKTGRTDEPKTTANQAKERGGAKDGLDDFLLKVIKGSRLHRRTADRFPRIVGKKRKGGRATRGRGTSGLSGEV